jgi:hypothetical protein
MVNKIRISMNKYIISVVLIKMLPLLDDNGWPKLSIQNEVGIATGMDEADAYHKFVKLAKERHVDHKVQLRVIIPINDDYEQIEEAQIVN